MNCPLNGSRNITEFICAGDVRAAETDAGDAALARSIYLEENLAGVVYEWWMHVPSAYWFVAQRDTRTDTILRTLSVEAFEALQAAS